MENENKRQGLNELIWQNQILKIPWIYIDRKKAYLQDGRKIIGFDEQLQSWIQVYRFNSIPQAKQFISQEIEIDLNSMESRDGLGYLTPEGFARYLRWGLLQTDVRDYLINGFTHLGFGPAIGILANQPVYLRNKLGIWRPFKELR